MPITESLWHVLDFLVPATGVGLLAATAAKLVWRRELGAAPWWRLAAAGAVAAGLCAVGGLALFGHDGKMATYVAMVLAAAIALWWLGFCLRPD